jgi:hypothetical protein
MNEQRFHLWYNHFYVLWYNIRAQVVESTNRTALVFTFDHGLDDQQSLHIMLSDVLSHLNLRPAPAHSSDSDKLPVSIEEAVGRFPTIRTVCWAFYQLYNAIRRPVLLPSLIERYILY